MKVIFMGTPDFAVPTLERLIEDNHEVSLVITQKDKRRGRGKKLQFPPIKEVAIRREVEIYQPEDINSEESILKIKKINPDVIIVVAYGQIIKKEILDIPKYGCLNIHASLLPKYRGAAPINWPIINGDEITGNTIMRMNEELDTGNMLKKSQIGLGSEMNSLELHDILKIDAAELLSKTLKELEIKDLEGETQDHSKSSYAKKLDKNLGRIDWNKTSEQIYNLIRGTQPWPGSFFQYKGENVKIKKARIADINTNEKPGKILSVDKDGITVATGEGNLIIEEIQFPGKKSMKVEDYLRGNKIEKINLE